MSEPTVSRELQAITSYAITVSDIDERVQVYDALEIKGVDDAAGLQLVHAGRMDLKKRRVLVEKRRKDLNREKQEDIRLANAAAKTITGWMEPCEKRLAAKEDAVLEQKARIKRVAEEQRQAVVRNRVEKLASLGSDLLAFEVEKLSHEEYAEALEQATETHAEREREAAEAKAEAEERKRVEAEAAEERRAETERLAEERKALEADRATAQAEIDRQRAEVQAEKGRLADERAERERAGREAKAEQERKDELERVKSDAAEKAKADAERERREAEERKQIEEATRPDREKLEALAGNVEEYRIPMGLTPSVAVKASKILASAAKRLRTLASDL